MLWSVWCKTKHKGSCRGLTSFQSGLIPKGPLCVDTRRWGFFLHCAFSCQFMCPPRLLIAPHMAPQSLLWYRFFPLPYHNAVSNFLRTSTFLGWAVSVTETTVRTDTGVNVQLKNNVFMCAQKVSTFQRIPCLNGNKNDVWIALCLFILKTLVLTPL